MGRAEAPTPETPNTYEIPTSAFKRTPTDRLRSPLWQYRFQPQPYQFGEQVSRDNFAAMVIDGFARSRGEIGAHYAYFEWLREHLGFDYEGTFNNYYGAGGFKSLAERERKLILRAYHRISAHLSIDPEIVKDLGLNRMIDINLARATQAMERASRRVFLSREMEQAVLLPRNEFLSALKNYILELKKKGK